MAQPSNHIDVYLEIGKRKTFAGAIEWPGWCRSGRDEASALQALLAYGPRYAKVLEGTELSFQAPDDLSAFAVIERLEGDATTDFGSPGAAPSPDTRALTEADIAQFEALLRACWQAFDATVVAAEGKELRKGPRGGGRDLQEIVQHVLGADAAYLGRLGRKLLPGEEGDPTRELQRTRQAILDGLAAAARGEVPEQGPRGGIRWTGRYFVRRVAWHVLDHAWEIEDRVI